MTENLALEGPKTLTAANSNVFSDFNLLAPTSSDTTWCTTNDSACDDQSMSIDSGNTDYGFYYNWYAATAGTGTYSVSSGDASSSICPKNWRLPKGGSSGNFQTLYSQYNSADKMRSNGDYADLKGPAFVLPGFRNGGSTSSQGGHGLYWSSTASNADRAYSLDLNSSNVYPAHNYEKYYGFTIRCIADDSTQGTLTVSPDTIDADTATTVDVSLPLSGDYNANISLGSTALTCSRTSTSPLSFSCSVPSTTSGTYTLTASLPSYGKTYSGSLTVETPGPSNFFELTTMQEMTPEICATATKPSASATNDDITGAYAGNTDYVPTKTVVDDRTDGATNTKHSYTIKKLADGKCWMTENLALVGPFTPSSDDSNVKSTSEFALTGSNTGTWCTDLNSSCIDKSMVINTGTKYGVLYNWYAATAGTGTYSLSSGNAESSICPKGWRLPIGGSSGDFQYLYSTAGYNSNALFRKSAGGPAFVLSGIQSGSTSDQGSGGYYWSSTVTAHSSDRVYYLYLDKSSVYPVSDYYRFYGMAVRCVAQ